MYAKDSSNFWREEDLDERFTKDITKEECYHTRSRSSSLFPPLNKGERFWSILDNEEKKIYEKTFACTCRGA